MPQGLSKSKLDFPLVTGRLQTAVMRGSSSRLPAIAEMNLDAGSALCKERLKVWHVLADADPRQAAGRFTAEEWRGFRGTSLV